MTTQFTREELHQTKSFLTIRRPGLAADLAGGADYDIFTVTGVVLVTELFGHVTTVIGAGAAVPFIEITTVVPAATVPLCALVVDISTDAVDTMYSWDGALAGVLTATPVGAKGMPATNTWDGGMIVLTAGVINVDNAVASTGIIDWYITYLAMSTGAAITIL